MFDHWHTVDVLFLVFMVVAFGVTLVAAVVTFFLTNQIWYAKEWHGDDFHA